MSAELRDDNKNDDDKKIIMIVMMMISNAVRTEWSAIQGVEKVNDSITRCPTSNCPFWSEISAVDNQSDS